MKQLLMEPLFKVYVSYKTDISMFFKEYHRTNHTLLVYSYDYDNNVQRGAASAGEDAPITVVAIGTSGAQWVRTTSTIEEQNVVNVSLVANLERNYSNPS